MTELRELFLRRTVLLGGASGFGLAFVVSCGIVLQRMTGLTVPRAIGANAVTTVVALLAVLATIRVFFPTFRAEEPIGGRRAVPLLASQSLGALVAVCAMHVAVYFVGVETTPWLREAPRQLVNDVVCVFAILSFVWGCAQRPLRLQPILAGLGLLVAYECTARLWHLDAPVPELARMPWSIQQFVGGEATATGLGILAFRFVVG